MGGLLGNLYIADALRQCDSQMHTSFVPEHFDHGSEFRADAVYKGASSLAVENAHPPNVAREMSFANKVREHFLIKGWWPQVHGTADGEKTVDEVRRNDEITETQSRKQDFAEGPDVNHARVGVEPLQGCERHALVAILTVIVIFDDPRSGVLGPVQ